jgi:hypothetical protein
MQPNHGTYTLRPILAPESPISPSDNIAEITKPWTPFALNADVLRNLQEWNKINQDTDTQKRLPDVLREVVEKVRHTVAEKLDSKGVQITLDTIPNGTIPAGNIVKGLVWITVLGLVRPL